jgi:hypothetical protein
MSARTELPTDVPTVFGTFYKYRSLATVKNRARVRDTIVNRRIKYSRPIELNDPFDCFPGVTLLGSPDQRRGELRKHIVEALGENAHRVSKRDIEAAVSENMAQLSDPEFRAQALYDALDQRTGVFCMSRDCAVVSQWAYYGDDHRGICLEFTITPDMGLVPCEVIYTDKRTTLDAMALLRRDRDAVEALFEALVTKSDVWEREDEVRALNRATGVQTYPPGMLTGIVFGARTRDRHIGWITALVKKAGLTVTFSKMVPDDETFQLKRKPLSRTLGGIT